MKTKTILIAAVMFLALSVSGFAQASFTVSSSPTAFVACCGETENAGQIAFQPRPGSLDSIPGTITVTYPVRITNPSSINVYSTAADFGGVPGIAPTVEGMVDPGDPFTIIISVGAGGHYPYSINVDGVLVDTSQLPCGSGAADIKAHVNSTGNLLTSGEQDIAVISKIMLALASPTATKVSFNAVTGEPGSLTAYYQVGESFPAAFDAVYMATNPKVIKLNIGKIPQGVQLTFPVSSDDASASSIPNEAGMFQLSSSAGTPVSSPQVVTSAGSPTSVYYMVATATDTTRIEYLRIPITVTAVGPYPIGPEAVSITAQMAPIDPYHEMIPRYIHADKCVTASVTIMGIEGATTTLLIPYSLNDDVGYDTGIAIANTTTDPGTAAMGFPQAVRQAGTMTFYFYPQQGSPFSYTTAADSPGAGLGADGKLATGRTYTVLLSELVAAAGSTDAFTGYVIVITNFTNAHGQYFVSDFQFFTNGALMLVLDNPDMGRAGPETLEN